MWSVRRNQGWQTPVVLGGPLLETNADKRMEQFEFSMPLLVRIHNAVIIMMLRMHRLQSYNIVDYIKFIPWICRKGCKNW
jgi:hypothetical protein